MSEDCGHAGPAVVAERWNVLGGEDGFVLPVGTVCLLLADIEGSTRLWEDDAEQMPALMADVDELISEVIGVHNGVRPVEQGEGDSFVAAFSKASDAVACALDLQLRLLEGPLRYRIGIHAGEVQMRGAGNYSGAFINRTARLRDVGHGGQVLLSRVAADLVSDHLPLGADLLDVGVHRLRDLARPEQLFQLTHPGLPLEFPPLRSLDAMATNLPVQLSTFVGRRRELAELTDLLPRTRLVTLTGSGGCGKTRLALEVAAATIDQFADGVWFCDLSTLGDPDAVPATLAATLGLREHGRTDWTRVIAEHVGTQRALVVLDNCEHVVAACAALADDLLRHCPNLRMIATSREPLGVTGEVSWRVPSLAAPDRRHATPIEALSAFDAVRLFIDRAAQARPNFAVTADNAPAIADICARLDGIPLAIELAAARVRVLGVEQIAAGLNDRFRLLGGGARTAMPRQQTLLASVAWSYDLLSEPERVVLRRLAVFAGSFGLDAAESVTAGEPVGEHDVLEILSQLVDRSLVQADDAVGPVRYRLLETMRQFAGDRLLESGEASSVRDLHLAWYDQWLDGVWQRTFARGDEGGHAEVEVEFDNIREALGWALDNPGQTAVGLHMVGRLWMFWLVQGRYSEGRRWAESMLAAAPDADADTRGEALLTLAWMADLQADFATAVGSAIQAATIARTTDNKRLLATSLEKIGWPLGLSDYAKAREYLTEGVSLAREVGDRRTSGMCLFFLGFHEGVHGELAGAQEHFDESIAERRLSPDTLARAQADTGKALVAAWQGSIAESFALLDDSLPVFERLHDPYWTMIGHLYRSMTAIAAGDVALARTALDAAKEAAAATDSPTTLLVQAEEPVVRLLEGRADEVAAAADVAVPPLALYGPRVGRGIEAQVKAAVAAACMLGGDTAGALAAADEAWTIAHEVDNPSYCPTAMAAVGTVLLVDDEVQAEQCAHEALAMCARSGALAAVPALLELLGAVARRQASHAEACRLLAAATAGRGLMGTRPTPAWGVDVDAEVAALRNTMAHDDFDAAWREGAGLSLDDAIAYARRGRGERKRPPTGWAALTPTELQVVALVAEGLSNPDIAARLFVSRRTVASHLTHVFTKLDVATRAELIAAVLRRS